MGAAIANAAFDAPPERASSSADDSLADPSGDRREERDR